MRSRRRKWQTTKRPLRSKGFSDRRLTNNLVYSKKTKKKDRLRFVTKNPLYYNIMPSGTTSIVPEFKPQWTWSGTTIPTNFYIYPQHPWNNGSTGTIGSSFLDRFYYDSLQIFNLIENPSVKLPITDRNVSFYFPLNFAFKQGSKQNLQIGDYISNYDCQDEYYQVIMICEKLHYSENNRQVCIIVETERGVRPNFLEGYFPDDIMSKLDPNKKYGWFELKHMLDNPHLEFDIQTHKPNQTVENIKNQVEETVRETLDRFIGTFEKPSQKDLDSWAESIKQVELDPDFKLLTHSDLKNLDDIFSLTKDLQLIIQQIDSALQPKKEVDPDIVKISKQYIIDNLSFQDFETLKQHYHSGNLLEVEVSGILVPLVTSFLRQSQNKYISNQVIDAQFDQIHYIFNHEVPKNSFKQEFSQASIRILTRKLIKLTRNCIIKLTKASNAINMLLKTDFGNIIVCSFLFLILGKMKISSKVYNAIVEELKIEGYTQGIDQVFNLIFQFMLSNNSLDNSSDVEVKQSDHEAEEEIDPFEEEYKQLQKL